MKQTLAQRAALRRVTHRLEMELRRRVQDARDVRAGERWAEFVADFMRGAAKKRLEAAMLGARPK